LPLQVRGFRDLREAPADPLLYNGFFNASEQNGVCLVCCSLHAAHAACCQATQSR
jgi:hypothetical protein